MAVDYEIHDHDVLIIGAGGAGLRAAIQASNAGASVGVVTKSLLGKAHTVMAEGGMAASLGNVDPADNWKVHFADTMRSGKMINNWRMVELFAKDAPNQVYQLERWGALFDRTPEGKIMQRPFGAHTYRRLAHVGDRTGLELIRTLEDRSIHTGATVYMECIVTRLLKDGDHIAGAFGYFRDDGRFVLFRAKAIILASGGWGRMYKVTSNSWECTGDGVAMAYEAGAELRDTEMVQFHPTGMVWPPGVRGILVTEGVRGEGGLLKNSLGERFMEKYDPKKMELSSRDVVARSIYREVQEGRGSPHGGAFLDISYKPADFIRTKLPSMYEQFKVLADIDITKEPMQVAPTVHYAMGGVDVDGDTAATTVPGLYAAGEVASGLHGANRLGGNSLSDLVVFGTIAGQCAADHARGIASFPGIDDAQIRDEQEILLRPFESGGGENPYLIHQDLQDIMADHAGISRTGPGLEEGLAKLAALRERACRISIKGSRIFNPAWSMARDDLFMLTVAEAVIRAALARTESRGAHWRLDYPELDPEQGKVNYMVCKADGCMEVHAAPIPPMPPELQEVIEETS
ncbi:MAG TPA: FAD-binding protein [Chloroflexota bacterium]|nr:FAD-binding protein [Chloroflexota bacterium]